MTGPDEQKIKQIANSWQDKRYRFLRILYEESGGSTQREVSDELIRQRASLTKTEFDTITEYFNGTLINAIQIGETNIARAGVDEVERSIKYPNRSTAHFPSIVIRNYNFYGSIQGGVQIEGQNNIQQVEIKEEE
jgi:hypothetical protein